MLTRLEDELIDLLQLHDEAVRQDERLEHIENVMAAFWQRQRARSAWSAYQKALKNYRWLLRGINTRLPGGLIKTEGVSDA